MSEKKQKQNQPNGFTLIELLVVVSIIVMLLGILVPGMRAFKRTADNLKQKSRFHAMEVGLELYQKDFREYPESKSLEIGSDGLVTGAHHLAEALLGRDTRGYDPKSNWYAPYDKAISDIYASEVRGDTPEDIKLSEDRRKGPYMDLKDVGAFRLNAGLTEPWYPSGGTTVPTMASTSIYAGDDDYTQPVISDIFYKKVITVENLETGQQVGFRVGAPVVYFRANTAEKQSRGYGYTSGTQITDYRKLVYNYEDNKPIFDLPVYDEMSLNQADHHQYSTAYTEGSPALNGDALFYEDITNEKVDQYARPVNARSFLLMSAGRDGIFGTKDDVTNFGK